MPARAAEQHDRGLHRIVSKIPMTASSCMAVGFVVALVMAAVMLRIFGVGERGTSIALRATARWSFLLFWLAYAGSALAQVFGRSFAELSRHGRDFGLGFAAAQLVHVGLVLWLAYVAGIGGAMLFFWVGILCTYLLALFSWPRLSDALGPHSWRVVRTIAVEYIALAFAADFILLPLQANGLAHYPLTYVPFAVMLFGAALLRAVAFWHNLPQAA